MCITFYHANQHITSAQCGLKSHSNIIIIKFGSFILYNIQYNITGKHSFQDNLLLIFCCLGSGHLSTYKRLETLNVCIVLVKILLSCNFRIWINMLKLCVG